MRVVVYSHRKEETFFSGDESFPEWKDSHHLFASIEELHTLLRSKEFATLIFFDLETAESDLKAVFDLMPRFSFIKMILLSQKNFTIKEYLARHNFQQFSSHISGVLVPPITARVVLGIANDFDMYHNISSDCPESLKTKLTSWNTFGADSEISFLAKAKTVFKSLTSFIDKKKNMEAILSNNNNNTLNPAHLSSDATSMSASASASNFNHTKSMEKSIIPEVKDINIGIDLNENSCIQKEVHNSAVRLDFSFDDVPKEKKSNLESANKNDIGNSNDRVNESTNANEDTGFELSFIKDINDIKSSGTAQNDLHKTEHLHTNDISQKIEKTESAANTLSLHFSTDEIKNTKTMVDPELSGHQRLENEDMCPVEKFPSSTTHNQIVESTENTESSSSMQLKNQLMNDSNEMTFVLENSAGLELEKRK